jgi:hypothetical protein
VGWCRAGGGTRTPNLLFTSRRSSTPTIWICPGQKPTSTYASAVNRPLRPPLSIRCFSVFDHNLGTCPPQASSSAVPRAASAPWWPTPTVRTLWRVLRSTRKQTDPGDDDRADRGQERAVGCGLGVVTRDGRDGVGVTRRTLRPHQSVFLPVRRKLTATNGSPAHSVGGLSATDAVRGNCAWTARGGSRARRRSRQRRRYRPSWSVP